MEESPLSYPEYHERIQTLPETLPVLAEGGATFTTPHGIKCYIHHTGAEVTLADCQSEYSWVTTEIFHDRQERFRQEIKRLTVYPRGLSYFLDSTTVLTEEILPFRFNITQTTKNTSSFPFYRFENGCYNYYFGINPLECRDFGALSGILGNTLSFQLLRQYDLERASIDHAVKAHENYMQLWQASVFNGISYQFIINQPTFDSSTEDLPRS